MSRFSNRTKSILRYKGETLSFLVVLIISLLLVFLLLKVNLLLLIFSLLFGLFYIRLLQMQQLGNSLQISNTQLPHIYKLVKECCEILEIKRVPNVYITQNPNLNAYTMGFGRSYAIVINSAIIENLETEEIRVVIAHELGHIKYRHTVFLSIISPLGNYFTFAELLFGFWGRRTEYTSDRCAYICTKDKSTLIRTLLKISAGPNCAKDIDIDELSEQLQGVESKIMGKLGETLGSHPYILKRIWEINKFDFKYNIRPCKECGELSESGSKFCEFCGKQL